MGLADVSAFSKVFRATLTPQVTVAGVPATSPGAAAYVEFESCFGIGSLTADLLHSIVTATGLVDATDDFVVQVLTQYYSGAIWDSANDQYSSGSWINLIPPTELVISATAGTRDAHRSLDFHAPPRPPIDLIQSLMTQVRDATNNLITNQKKNHFTTPNTHRHTYSGGITGDASAAGKPWEGHGDFRIWARHMLASDANNTYAVNVQIGLS